MFGDETGSRESTRMAWTNTRRRAKMTGLRFHDLRCECCSRVLESGASLHVVRDRAGHAKISTTSRYLAVSLAAMQKSVKGFEEHSERAGAQPPKASTPETVHPTVQ